MCRPVESAGGDGGDAEVNHQGAGVFKCIFESRMQASLSFFLYFRRPLLIPTPLTNFFLQSYFIFLYIFFSFFSASNPFSFSTSIAPKAKRIALQKRCRENRVEKTKQNLKNRKKMYAILSLKKYKQQ